MKGVFCTGVPLTFLLPFSIVIYWFPASSFAAEDPVLVGAGDIAECWLGFFNGTEGAEATATLLDNIRGTVSPLVTTLIVKRQGKNSRTITCRPGADPNVD